MVNHTWATHPTKVITAVEEEEVVEVMGEGLIVQWPTSWCTCWESEKLSTSWQSEEWAYSCQLSSCHWPTALVGNLHLTETQKGH